MDAGNYTLLARLGEGPLGALHEGVHKQTEARAQILVLPSSTGKENNALGRLMVLQRALGRIEAERSTVMPLQQATAGDPAFATIHECGRTSDGSLFVASEFINGEPLTAQLRRHAGLPLPNKALRLGRQLASALAIAHSHSLYHLRLRPESIVQVPSTQEQEHLKILDLGLWAALGLLPSPAHETSASIVYLPPEYRTGEGGVSGQADVYSLGVILYELASGNLPPQLRVGVGGHLGAEGQTSLIQMLPTWIQPLAETLDRMLAPVAGARPTMAQVAASFQQLSMLAPSPTGNSGPISSATPRFPSSLSGREQGARTVAQTPPVAEVAAPVARPAPEAPASAPVEPVNSAPVTSADPLLSAESLAEAALRPDEWLAGSAADSQKTPSGLPDPLAEIAAKRQSLPPPAKKPVTPEPERVLEISMVEEPTLGAQPTQLGSSPLRATKPGADTSTAGGAKAPSSTPDAGQSDVVEMQAEYTQKPHQQTGRALATGTGNDRTAATAVEPGVGGSATLKIGQLVGNFKIQSKIGQGGMGAVYAAVHKQIGRRAAVKILHGPLAKTSDYAQRFLNEARAVNILQHPNLVEIFDFGQLADGTLYIIMEFLEGESLRARLRRSRKIPQAEAMDLARQMATALEPAHQKGIIHRDLKPENVMLIADPQHPDESKIKILDFGIAKVNTGTQPGKKAPATESEFEEFQTAIGTTMGTPKYMAPEQYADASKVDGKADVFALGVMLYEMVAGQPPFAKTSLAAFHKPPRPIIELEPGVSPQLAELIHRMLTPKPLDRPAMREVLEFLTPMQAASKQTPAMPPPRVRWAPWLFGTALLAAVGMGGFMYMRGIQSQTSHQPQEGPEEADLLVDVTGPKARALGVLYQGVKSQIPEQRAHAARMLGQSRDVMQWSSVVGLLKDLSYPVQVEAAEALGQIGAGEASKDLLTSLEGTPPPPVRVALAGALARLAHPKGKEALRALMQDPDERIQTRAALKLLETGDTGAADVLRAVLKKGTLPDDQALRIMSHLAQTGDAAAKQQLAARMSGDGMSFLRISAAGQLNKLGDEGAKNLLVQASQRSGPQQLVAGLFLASTGDRSVYSMFKTSALDQKQPSEARSLAMEGLGSCGRRQGALVLAGVLDEAASSPTLRQVAAGAILQITGGDPAQIARQSMSWAQSALGHDDWLMRAAATDVLADLESEQAVPLLQKALTDEQQEVRKRAATALGQKSFRAALSALRTSLDDADADVRQAGLKAMVHVLSSMGTAGVRATTDETRAKLRSLIESGTQEEQIIASTILSRLGDTAQLARLRAVLASTNPLLRKLVVESTAGDDGLLKQALTDTDPEVRFTAARRLAAMKQREAIPVLKEALDHGGEAGLLAFSALKRLGEPVSAPPGLSGLLGKDTTTSLAVLDAALELPPQEALSILQKTQFDNSTPVRRRTAEVTASLYQKKPEDGLQQILYTLANDRDVGVRTRAGSVMARLMGRESVQKDLPEPVAPPDLAAPEDLAVAVVAKEHGQLRITGEPGVGVQIDQQAGVWLTTPQLDVSVPAGRHTVRFLRGTVEVLVPPGEIGEVHVSVSQAEQLLHDAGESITRRELARAQRLIEQAKSLLAKGRGPKTALGDVYVQQARILEAQFQVEEAMTEIQKVQRLPELQRRPDQAQAAQNLIARLTQRLGKLRISKEVDGRCETNEQWVRPGEHIIDRGNGQSDHVRVREGKIVEVKLCGQTTRP